MPEDSRLEGFFAVSDEKYRSLIQKVQTAIVIHDGKGQIVVSNRLAESLLGFSADNLLGKELGDPEWHFLRENGAELSVSEYPVSLVLSSKQPLRDMVTGISRPDRNKVTWVLLNAEPEYDNTGEIEQVVVSFVDITERKRVEEALRESERRFKDLLASVTSYMYTVKLECGRVIATTHGPGCQAVTGFSTEDYAIDPDLWHRMIHPEDRSAVLDETHKLLTTKTAITLEHRIQHKDGSTRWVQTTLVPCVNPYGQLLSYDGVITDITERKRVEEIILQLNEELEQRVRERTKDLERRNHELEEMNKAFVGRELRMMELKKRISELEMAINPASTQDRNLTA
jgi:PAS domain S-box-containing protein